MTLDDLAAGYARNLFVQRFDELAQQHQKRLTDVHHELLVGRPKPITIHDVFYHSETIRLGVDFIASVPNARADGLLTAYKRARVPIDDEAVRDIARESMEWFARQSSHLADKIHREAEQGGLATNDRQYLDLALQSQLAPIASKLALKLSQIRDEHLLDARTAANARAAAETNATTAPVASNVEAASHSAEKWSWAAWWENGERPQL